MHLDYWKYKNRSIADTFFNAYRQELLSGKYHQNPNLISLYPLLFHTYIYSLVINKKIIVQEKKLCHIVFSSRVYYLSIKYPLFVYL